MVITVVDAKYIIDHLDEQKQDSIENESVYDTSVVSLSCKVNSKVNLEMLNHWIECLITEDGANLYWYKGGLAVKGKELKFVFQGVGILFSGNFEGLWKDRETRDSRFFFIGKNLDKEFLKLAFETYKVKNELRILIGQNIYANAEEFKKGKFIAVGNHGQLYQVQLDDGPQAWLLLIFIPTFSRKSGTCRSSSVDLYFKRLIYTH